MQLNDTQRIMADHHEGPMLAVAVAGSGKTTAVIHNLVNKFNMGFDMSRVMVTAFNKDAASQIKTRLNLKIPSLDTKFLPIGTSHSLFNRIMLDNGMSHNGVYPSWQAERILKAVLEPRYYSGEAAFVYSAISYLKNSMAYCYEVIGLDCYQRYQDNLRQQAELCGVDPETFNQAFLAYEEDKLKRGQIDYDDMLFKCYIFLHQSPEVVTHLQDHIQHLIIDEYQDTNAVQYALFKMLAAKHQNIIAVGDDDQSIYGFRGADPGYIQSFQRDYPECRYITMAHNYRSQRMIVDMANELIRHNRVRLPKEMISTKDLILIPEYIMLASPEQEAQFITGRILSRTTPFREVAALTRTNMQQALIEREFCKHNIPYIIAEGNTFYEKKEVQMLLKYLAIAYEGPDVRFDFVKDLANKPYRRFGKDDSKLWTDWNQFQAAAETDNRFAVYMRHLEMLSNLTQTPSAIIEYLLSPDVDLGKWADKNAGLSNEVKPSTVIYQFMAMCEGISTAEVLEEAKRVQRFYAANKGLADKATISTIHRAKGLEWGDVYIPGVNEGIFPHKMTDNREEDRRLLYVAITRAKWHVTLTGLKGEDLVESPFMYPVMDLIDFQDEPQ